MAPISPGFEAAPPRKVKKLTSSSNLHRFESFTKRISRLKIDPVHTVEKRNSNNENDLSQSFFRTSLEEWAELNLSHTFTSFLNKASPLCENLPQLLHHADTIFDLLVQHIEKKDALALEPLLSLLAHLAHDLGQSFEQYFARSVTLVTHVAATHESADVIEWSFTCLAWMFKYLSRLLVRDLRPLLNIMTPYLSAKKDYILRFSAESLAFLLRKAAVLYPKRKAPLSLAVKHLMQECSRDDRSASLHPYRNGVIALCAESVRGIDGQLHSSSESLVRCLLDTAVSMEEEVVRPTVDGVLIALIHETNRVGFQPVFEVVLDRVRQCAASVQPGQLSFALRLLTVVMGTRKGSRIPDWTKVIQAFLEITEACGQTESMEIQTKRRSATVSATILQYAPMDHLLPVSQKLLDSATKTFSPREFFGFCTLCATLGKERFTILVLPRLQQYIVTCWSDDEVSVYYLGERLHQDGILSVGEKTTGSMDCPQQLQDFITGQLSIKASELVAWPVHLIAGRVHLARNLRFSQNPEGAGALLSAYRSLIADALNETGSGSDLRWRVLLGWAFETYLDMLPDDDSGIKPLLRLALGTSPTNFRLPSFLHASNRLCNMAATFKGVESSVLQRVRYILVQNLLSSSVSLKVESLRLLSLLATPDLNEWISESIDLMLHILGTSYTPAEARQIAMLLRRLPQRQIKVASDSDFQNMIPFFALGLLSNYHDQTRKEVCNILAQMVEGTSVEETVIDVAMQWLQTPPELASNLRKNPEQTKVKPSAFECMNLSQIDELCDTVFDDFQNSSERLHKIAENEHHWESTRTPVTGRTLALHVLLAMPASAERRSRLFVPIFLAAPMRRGQLEHRPNSDASMSSHTMSPELDDSEWSLSDRRALLTLLGKFVNPRVLFRSSEVYDKLIDLLSNGNREIRKLALQAVFTWKEPVLTQYDSTLLQVVEEKFSTTYLETLLSVDEEQTTIKPNDRNTVLPILLRLIFGLIVGRAGTTGSQEARRKSILRALFRMREGEIATFLNIALGNLKNIPPAVLQPDCIGPDPILIPDDQQYGFLRLLLSMLETLQSQFAPYGVQVVDAIIFCIVRSSHQNHAPVNSSSAGSALSRNIRRSGFQCLVLLFEHCPGIDWPRYLPVLFRNAISPRLENFASETNQGISGLLRLFASWVHLNDLISYLREYDERVPDVLWQCLTVPSAQKEVKVFILEEIVLPWIHLAEDKSITPNKAAELLRTVSDDLLKAIMVLLERQPPKEILSAITSVLPRIPHFATSPKSQQNTVSLLTGLLSDSAYKTPPSIKSQLLLSIRNFLNAGETVVDENLQTKIFNLVSSLFNYFKDQPNRGVLCDILENLSNLREIFMQPARLCHDLNAVSAEHLDEIDYDRRLQAFQAINSMDVDERSCIVWRPLTYNLLFFMRTVEDFSIRSNALSSLKQFIIKACAADIPELIVLIKDSILPSAKKCIKDESELVRADFVSLFGLLVQHIRDDPDLENMAVLLVGNDEEASFFSNILHIQQHRRVRAIHRLTSEVEKGAIRARNNAEVFIPLLEMFVDDSATDESAQSIKGQSITAMGTLLQWIDWKHFKGLFRKYKNEIDANESDSKAASKLLGYAADALMFAKDPHSAPTRSHLAETLPDNGVVEDELRTHFIPKLAELVHYKDEAEISFRVPIAVTAIKLITMLPQEEVPMVAAPIILDIAQILRSRTHESRDVARNALCQIVLKLGPSSLQFVLKELRTALTRGYQLHVVSYTLHAILVAITPVVKLGELDYCVDELVMVIMDDIFGTVGQEKDNQDYVSSMKEVKSRKSYDSMELLARTISISTLSKLASPLQTLLLGTLTTKQARQVDELLRRLGVGLSQNPVANKRDILVFAYQLIQTIYQQKGNSRTETLTLDERSRQRYLVQLGSTNKTTSAQTSPLLYKLTKFALDLVRSTLQKYNDVLTAENVHGFLPIIGDALIENQEDVKISALRLLSAIIKLPMTELDENTPLYVMEAVKVVKNSTNTNEEAAQAALKLVAAVLRERRSVKVRDLDIADLLHRISPDIEEPDRQGVTFNFIRAVMARKVQVPEIYELADKIGIMMVTNQAKGSRDLARGVYVHFLLEYPQSSTRWAKQQKFLMKNLEYDYPEGRQSVMEAINTLVGRIKGETAQNLISTFFIPVLLRMANDDHQGCRELAGVLLGQLFRIADRSHVKDLLEPLRSWVEQEENRTLQEISLQAYGVLLRTETPLEREEIGHIRDNLTKILSAPVTDDGDDWGLPFQALLLLSKLVDSHPDTVLNQRQTQLWSPVWKSLERENSWIQSGAASLIHEFLRHCVSTDHSTLPLTCDHGLHLRADEFLNVLKTSARILRRKEGGEDLSAQMVQNLLFLGQCADVNGLMMEVADKSGDEEDNDSEIEEQSDSDDDAPRKTKDIPAIQYLLDQVTRILRAETSSPTSAALLPKRSSLTLLSHLIPTLSMTSLTRPRIQDILLPLQHLTDPNTVRARSADPTFAVTYQDLIELAHDVMEKVQNKLGDTEYVKALTEVSKIMRERREQRRTKRRIERVAEPEKAARDKKRKSDRKKERKKEIGRAHQKRRREIGMR
ncbi:uncharacterized protein Z518_07223 [Rhinocladiella mackenziei CBS 650.93]|uniref:HEAT repeat protein n=1 Tax=Rhinocladiella mackenziei CBS 650.93 TaxID=1442369 RepID=A0A0D2J3V2_9EURO|nr:uncharacterized protein Z518_07223 [Rhinocladiella mackenziei CBS 650.93]KIX03670.1 hypothetical protein Z518_07223 [Rhinocladiella mackenziei CBS 650.93]